MISYVISYVILEQTFSFSSSSSLSGCRLPAAFLGLLCPFSCLADTILPGSLRLLDGHRLDIHTGIFQGKIKNFPGLETPPVRSSDPTVQYSVGPMVRSYTRHVPILRTFFITEFRGSRSSGLTCQKNVKNFPGENFPGQNFPGQNFPGENFPGENFPGE